MSTTAEVYALAYCARFDIDRMQRQRDDTHRSVICRNVLHETWRSGEVFIFDYGVLVFWRLDVEARADEQKHKHSSLLEWIIICLIFIEIVMFLVQDFING